MSCRDRDQDLLLLIHGELPLWRQISLNMHLWHCSRCQAAQRQFTQVSHTMANTLRGPEMPPWSLTRTPAIARYMQRAAQWRLITVLLIILLLTVALFKTATFVRSHHAVPSATTPGDNGCQPGLPNDRCR